MVSNNRERRSFIRFLKRDTFFVLLGTYVGVLSAKAFDWLVENCTRLSAWLPWRLPNWSCPVIFCPALSYFSVSFGGRISLLLIFGSYG